MSFGRPPSLGNVGFKPNPPDRGSFPLDHFGECKDKMQIYMQCLQTHSNDSTPCRALTREYLDCRMKKGLMQRDDWKNLGLDKVQAQPQGGGTPAVRTFKPDNPT
ncbi:hypothetical protein FISHEDRAFT_47367 [Fistulina hepatica ATCC 64428]|uniref:Cytochrome c oxidase assembly protein COX19 n=1 Tax=Fistulina hepatica ATCC 64428 TaxID=1128425 RepID=A0A0D7A5V7_9AGAR|nr:hypothetical protein FISHEDRAFT_47367 [Fistulina hepatica ATCC 64428]